MTANPFPVAWAPTFATDRLHRLAHIVERHGLRCGDTTIPGDPRAPIEVTVTGDDVDRWQTAADRAGANYAEDGDRWRTYTSVLDFTQPAETVVIRWRLYIGPPSQPYDGPEPVEDFATPREMDRQADVEMQRRVDQAH